MAKAPVLMVNAVLPTLKLMMAVLAVQLSLELSSAQ